jgi:O-antigen ligase
MVRWLGRSSSFSNASVRRGRWWGCFAMRMAHWADARLTSVVPSLPFAVCALVTVSSLVLGGGARSGYLSDAILQLLSIPPLLVSLWQLVRTQAGARRANPLFKWGLTFCVGLVGIPLIQLVPLPPAIWTMLPNRQAVVEALELVGGDLPWMPISVSPEATWLSALSLIPPVAVFLSTQLLSYAERRWMSLLVLAIGLISVFLGLLQVAQGPSSPSGLFANKNHFAAFIYALIMLAACWVTEAVFRVRTSFNRKVHDTTGVAALVMTVAIIVVFLSAEAMVRSRAGLALTILAAIGAFALAWKEWRTVSRGTAGLVVGGIALICLFVGEFTLYRIMERFADDPLADSRITFARNTFTAAMDYMPFGSGIGSFVPVYGMYERSSDTIANVFVNHAHNDILEICLEAGVLGIVMTGIFVVWMLKTSLEIWRSSTFGSCDIDLWLARSATIMVMLIAFHSFVDYPLRTAAIMAVVAFACGLLVPPQGRLIEWPRDRKAAAKHSRERQRRRPPARVGGASLADSVRIGNTPSQESGRDPCGEGMKWPEAWRKGPQGEEHNP